MGHRIETWARQTKHADSITWFLSKLEAEAREDSSSELQWSVPTARSDRAYNWGDSAIAPDAVGHLFTGGPHVPFYLEHELRARHPRGVIARLRPYESYYWSPEHKDDQPPFPTTLFVVDTEEVEDTYVNTAARMSRMSLPILVLFHTGMLGRSSRLSSFTYSEHPCGADRANTLSGRATILHHDSLGIAHLPLRPALHAVSFQDTPPNL